MMIASNPIGGLGNQLFQIFTAIAYGIQYGRRILFTYQSTTLGVTSRPTYWHNLLKHLQIFTTACAKDVTNHDINQMHRMQENGHHYTELPATNLPQFQLWGYFQSPKYFEPYMERILKMIRFSALREEVLQEYSHYFETIKETGDNTDKKENITWISMHFRLGDYKPLQHCHPLMTYDYYEKAFTVLLSHIKEDSSQKVLYFCEKEDISEVNSIIERLIHQFPHITFSRVDDRIEDWKQMILMTGCRHHIIANSTFSWWGAYLNPSQTKLVCYPSVWFGYALAHLKIDDLFPVGWIKIG